MGRWQNLGIFYCSHARTFVHNFNSFMCIISRFWLLTVALAWPVENFVGEMNNKYDAELEQIDFIGLVTSVPKKKIMTLI